MKVKDKENINNGDLHFDVKTIPLFSIIKKYHEKIIGCIGTN